jgi:hypothetical protein
MVNLPKAGESSIYTGREQLAKCIELIFKALKILNHSVLLTCFEDSRRTVTG